MFSLLPAHFTQPCIQLYKFTFRDLISDLFVTVDYDLIELLYNFQRNDSNVENEYSKMRPRLESLSKAWSIE